MPDNYRRPGVYIQEQSYPDPLEGVETTITAFPGRFTKGPVGKAVSVSSFAEFEDLFGDGGSDDKNARSIWLYFENGGRKALIYRLFKGDTTASTTGFRIPTPEGSLLLSAKYPGIWGNNLTLEIQPHPEDSNHFRLTVQEQRTDVPGPLKTREIYERLSLDPASRDHLHKHLESSNFLRVTNSPPEAAQPAAGTYGYDSSGDNGEPINEIEILRDNGLIDMDEAPFFNLLCLPDPEHGKGFSVPLLQQVAHFCRLQKAVCILGPHPVWTTPLSVKTQVENLQNELSSDERQSIAQYYPDLIIPDPSDSRKNIRLSPVGAVAGVIARTTIERGVWKAPAGSGAGIEGCRGLAADLPDADAEQLNAIGVNSLKVIPGRGAVIWGGRTLDGSNRYSSEGKYLSIKRLMNFIRQSVEAGTGWTAFEPNSAETWNALRQQTDHFLDSLFRNGAFAGSTPHKSYYVRCGTDTMSEADQEQGLIRLEIGVAPIRPSEFIILVAELSAQPVQR